MTESLLPGLKAAHLENLAQEARAALDQAKGAAPETFNAGEARPDPKGEKTYAFVIERRSRTGAMLRGHFVNKILSIGEKISVGVMRARLQMGASVEALSVETFNLLYMVTWMQQSLTTKPDWAKDLLALESEELVKAIFDEVDAHEAYFRQPLGGAQKGEAAAPS